MCCCARVRAELPAEARPDRDVPTGDGRPSPGDAELSHPRRGPGVEV